MIRIEKRVFIELPVEDVYAFILNFENESKWFEEVIWTKKTSEGPIGVGSTFTDHVKFMGRTIESSYEILSCNQNKTISIRTFSGAVPFSAT